MFASNTSAANGAANYIEDVFSTYLYTGNGSTQTITNGIDLAGKGGLVWIKRRDTGGYYNVIFDTNRGTNNYIFTNDTAPQNTFGTTTNALTSFNANGFSLGADTKPLGVNENGASQVSWTFRKQPKFFDMVTYTGDGTDGRQITHSLGSVPGCIIVKRTNNTGSWPVWHRSSVFENARLNTTASVAGGGFYVYGDTSTTFQVNNAGGGADSNAYANISGATYVAYLFAHNAGGFGLSGTENVVSCGSFTTDAGVNASVNLGWEPQWLIIKNITSADNWWIVDNMRGYTANDSGNTNPLVANMANAEFSNYPRTKPTSTGFVVPGTGLEPNKTYIYIAIRRGPMQVPTDGTKVFAPCAQTGEAAFNNSFPVDLVMERDRTSSAFGYTADRLRGGDPTLSTTSTAAEFSAGPAYFDSASGTFRATFIGGASPSVVYENFGRAPSFMDVVCYTGTGSEPSVQNHNLGVTPELMIIKSRSAAASWLVYSNFTSSSYNWGVLQTTNAFTNSPYGTGERMYAQPTSTTFTLSNYSVVNASGGTYVAYLFATCPGVSKVGSYTGNGTTQTLNCGFTSGARFVLIKRTNSTGDWYVWDTARGIVAGNDPHLSLNTSAAEVITDDSIDPDSTGFIVNQVAATNINVTSATYIYLAIA